MAAEFAALMPMEVEPRVTDDLRIKLNENIETLKAISDDCDETTAALLHYKNQSFALLDSSLKNQMSNFLDEYRELTRCVETYLMLVACRRLASARLQQVIEALELYEISEDKVEIKRQNIGFLNENLEKLNACLTINGPTFNYHEHYPVLNMTLEYNANRGKIYNMIVDAEKQVYLLVKKTKM
jgi:hypothetical protein